MNQKDAPDLQRILSDRKKVEQLISSREAQALARLLAGQEEPAKLRQAARQAAAGNTRELGELLRSITASPQGAQLLQKLQQTMEGK